MRCSDPPSTTKLRDADRVFEAIWSVEPEVVRDAARACAAIAARTLPALVEPIPRRIDHEPAPVTREQLRIAAAITNRILSDLG